MRRVRWVARARRDFIELTDDYANKDPFFPPKLLDKIDHVTGLLATYPGLGERLRGKRDHKYLVRGTNYILVYRGTRSELIVKRFVDARSNWLEPS